MPIPTGPNGKPGIPDYRPCSKDIWVEELVKNRWTKMIRGACIRNYGHENACSKNVDDVDPIIVSLYFR